MNQFICQIGEKKTYVPGPSNFHINMTYVLSSMFCAEPDQPAGLKDDYVSQEPMMALVNVKEVSKVKFGLTNMPDHT